MLIEDFYKLIISSSNITIYYEVKKVSFMINLDEFIPIDKGGKISWNKIYIVKYNDEIIWDLKGLCYNLSSIEPPLKEYLPENFKIMTFNIMSDFYDKNITDFNLNNRLDKIISLIQNSDCDIICLQEVTNDFLKRLKSTNLHVNITNNKGRNDIVIISKILPISSKVLILSNRKQAMQCEFKLENGKKIKIVSYHLSSDARENCSNIRTKQINMIKQTLNPDDNVILLGDTNEVNRIPQLSNFIECETDYTYNPETNPFAKKLSKKGIKSKFDRIYFYGNLNCVSSNIVENNKTSDHYPALANFSYSENPIKNEMKLNNKTALVILPPYEIQKSLSIYNPKWMPHLNIFWPFLELSDLIQYYNLFDKIKFDPFTITFNSYGSFTNKNTIIVFLKMKEEDEEKIKLLREKFITICPLLKSDYIPHLSLYKIKNSDNFILPTLDTPISFEFSSFHVISRENSEYMQVERIIGNKNSTNDQIVKFFSLFCKEVKICGSNFFYDGSEIITDTDLDLVCIGDLERTDFFNLVYKEIRQCGIFISCEIIRNRHINEMKLIGKNIEVDLHYLNRDIPNDPYNDNISTLIDYPMKILSNVKDKKLFLDCFLWFKQFCKDNQIYGQPYGYFCGIHVAIITCYLINKYSIESIEIFKNSLCKIDGNEFICCNPNVNFSKEIVSDSKEIIVIIVDDKSKNTIKTMSKTTNDIIISVLNGKSLSYTNKVKFTIKYKDYYNTMNRILDMNILIRKFLVSLEYENIKFRHDSRWLTEEDNDDFISTYNINYDDNNKFTSHFDWLIKEIMLVLDSSITFSFELS